MQKEISLLTHMVTFFLLNQLLVIIFFFEAIYSVSFKHVAGNQAGWGWGKTLQ